MGLLYCCCEGLVKNNFYGISIDKSSYLGNNKCSYYVKDTVRVFFFQLQPFDAALVRTNYKLSEAKPRIHLLFVRTKAASNGCNRILWMKERVQQVVDAYDNN